MSADLLRRAASLMRERAKACVSGFEVGDDPGWYNQPKVLAHALRKEYGAGGIYDVDAEHIASWHPAVALLAAESMEQHAGLHETHDCVHEPCAHDAWARAYLGESA